MRQVSSKQLAAMLERRGWRLLRTKGNHPIYGMLWRLLRTKGNHPIYGMLGRVERISVPVHGNQPLEIGILRHLLNIAWLNESELD